MEALFQSTREIPFTALGERALAGKSGERLRTDVAAAARDVELVLVERLAEGLFARAA